MSELQLGASLTVADLDLPEGVSQSPHDSMVAHRRAKRASSGSD